MGIAPVKQGWCNKVEVPQKSYPARFQLPRPEPAVGRLVSRKALATALLRPEVLTSGDPRFEPIQPQSGTDLMPTTLTGGNQVEPLGKHPR